MDSWAGLMGGRMGGALGRRLPGLARCRVGRRARVLRGRSGSGSGSGCSAGICARIPISMAVEEEGLRVFQSVKIKIGELSGAGGDGGVFAGLGVGAPRSPIRSWRCALPGRGPSPLSGDGRSRCSGNAALHLSCAASGPKLLETQCRGWGPSMSGKARCRTQIPYPLGVCACVRSCVCINECVRVRILWVRAFQVPIASPPQLLHPETSFSGNV